MMHIFCPDCGDRDVLTTQYWRCGCGAAWEPEAPAGFDLTQIQSDDHSIWRYSRLYGIPFETPFVRLGAGGTPLVPINLGNRKVLCKLEYFAPTSSFKDRGVEMMINLMVNLGVKELGEDSSGNAGASVAAYASAAGIKTHIYAPESASPAKLAQIQVYGGELHLIPGPRVNAKTAVQQAAENGLVMGSHAYHPGFLLGLESIAWEVWEQMGRSAPEWYVVPVGQGGNLLGAWLGFQRLKQAGLIERLPRFIAVQPELLAPLCRAFDAGLGEVPPLDPPAPPSIAEGLAITQPVRGKRLLQALRGTDGLCVTVPEQAIIDAQKEMALRGLYIEPTSATAVAAIAQVSRLAAPTDTIALVLTGSGLKSPSRPG